MVITFGVGGLHGKKREVAIRIICYNIEVVARYNVKNGRLTLAALAA